MKAVIVELRGTQAAAFTNDGCVRKIKNKHYTVGQTVEIKAQKQSVQIALRIAAAAAAITIIGIPTYAYYTPYSYVSLDINPSIEYSLNRFDRVLSYTAVNGDGDEVLEHLSLKHKNIQEAIELTLSTIMDKGYLTTDEPSGILITASCEDEVKSDDLAEALADIAEATAQEEALDVEIEAESVGQERVQQAQDLGMTPGKLNLIEKLQQSMEPSEELLTQDWQDKSVKELMEQTKKNNKTNSQSSGNSNGNSTNKDNTSSQKTDKDQVQEQQKHQEQQQTKSETHSEKREQKQNANVNNNKNAGKDNSSGSKSKH